ERLRLCYEIAPQRVKQYLKAEIEFVLEQIHASDLVLELGCGYGRILQHLIRKVKMVVGIDTSPGSLKLAKEEIGGAPCCHLVLMNAVELGFHDRRFDVVACIQNGISAFKVDQRKLIEEAVRVTGPGGRVLFSSYSERFWNDRLEWFRIQSDYGLIGEIDDEKTGKGLIVCKDGFKAATFGVKDFRSLTSEQDLMTKIIEVDGSSIFCEILVQ
ncbi:MAG: class I SAM-dependent methyltransferase, partial [Calditrichia bacterium]